MLDHKELEKKTEEELKEICQKLKSDFDNTSSKNIRIRGMLNRKIEIKKGIIKKIQTEIDDILGSNLGLNVAKDKFDDEISDPSKLKEEIQDMQRSISTFRTRKLKTEEGIKDFENHIESQKLKENQLQEEIELLIKENQNFSGDNTNQKESNELTTIAQEYQQIQNELASINDKINDLNNRIHNNGK